MTLPALFGRFYLTVVAGRERRNPARRAAERRRHPLLRFGNLVVLAGAGTLLGFAGLALVQLAARAWMQHHGLLD